MPICIGSKEYKDIFVGATRIRRGYLGDILFYQYDEIAPTLSVASPAGYLLDAPSYTSSSLYTVSGTIFDADSGVDAVYVNNEKATVDGDVWYATIELVEDVRTSVSVYAVDNAGNKTEVVTRYVTYTTSVPTLTVTAPTGTAKSPTYYETSATSVSYTVYGTVSDSKYPIKSVTVNGKEATINGNNWTVNITFTSGVTHVVTIVATNEAGISTVENRYLLVTSSIDASTQQTMAYVFTGSNGGANSLKATNVTSQSVEGTGWHDTGHELIITYAAECVPTSLTFTTPAIVNSVQAYEVTYSIYGSNSAYRSTLSSMKWEELISQAQWTQSGHIGNETKTLTIPSNGKMYKHIRMVTTWFYSANEYHGVYYGNLHTSGHTVISDLELDESIIYDSGRLQDNVSMSHLELVGVVTRESNAILMNSNPDKEVFLQPYAAIGMKLDGYGEYQNINIDYKDWSQSGTTSSAKFAVCNNLQIDLGSNHRDWNSVVTKTHATSKSGTITMPWTDGKYLSVGAFSQSNQNSKLRVTKIYFSDSTVEPYNKALSLVGLNTVSSLDAVLTNLTSCYAIAENMDAVDIMKENYSNEIATAIDSNWNEGLNMLAYQCKLKCYIIKNQKGVNGFHNTTNGMYLTSHSNDGDYYYNGTGSSNPIETYGYSKALIAGYAQSGYGNGEAALGLSAYRKDEIGDEYSYGHVWENNCSRTRVGAAKESDGGTSFTNTVTLGNYTHAYPFIMMYLPLSNGYGHDGKAYFIDFALVP